MRSFLSLLASPLALLTVLAVVSAQKKSQDSQILSPKFMIISLFAPEAEPWYDNGDCFNLLAHNISLPGLSPTYPAVHCSEDYDVCQIITAEAEINAASTISALVLSPQFNLTKTYFMIAGIAGINPNQGSIADVTFARYVISVALQYEFDAREKPDNFSTGYFPLGSNTPQEYPQSIYGTEVFEVNDALRQAVIEYAKKAALNDSASAQAYRSQYPTIAAKQSPSVRACDVATSDVFYSGALLGDAFADYTTLVTNGSGIYCTTAQEDTAILEPLLRGAVANKSDFSRIIVMRTASNFERPHPGESILQNLVYEESGVSTIHHQFIKAVMYLHVAKGFDPSVRNLYLAGIEIVNAVVSNWDAVFEAGIQANNYGKPCRIIVMQAWLYQGFATANATT